MIKLFIATLSSLFFMSSSATLAEADNNPWAPSLATGEVINSIMTIEARASVKVSDGLIYDVETSWLDNERSIFHRSYPDRKVTLGRAGLNYWSFDGEKQKTESANIRDIILGHQFHAKILFFEKFVQKGSLKQGVSNLCDCKIIEAKDPDNNIVTLHYDKKSLRPQFHITYSEKYGEIKLTYGDWRIMDGVNLPFKIEIDHDGRHFIYQYKDINFNSKTLNASLLTPLDLLKDEQKLIRHHRNMIDAHIDSDVSLMGDVWGEQVTFVNNGIISKVKGAEAAKGLGQSLNRRKHSLYIDMAKPIVTLSKDASLGFVMVQVKAEGVRVNEGGERGEAFSFESAWTSTFEKKDGKWKMTSNTSNFKP